MTKGGTQNDIRSLRLFMRPLLERLAEGAGRLAALRFAPGACRLARDLTPRTKTCDRGRRLVIEASAFSEASGSYGV